MSEPTVPTETPKRHTKRRITNNGYQERLEKQKAREERLDNLFEALQPILTQFTQPPPPFPSNYVAPVFDEAYYKKQEQNTHNYEMRTLLKNFVVIQTAIRNNDMTDWEDYQHDFIDTFNKIDAQYPIT